MTTKIPLTEVLTYITDELLEADRHAQKRGESAMIFDECELEFAIEVEKSGESGIKVWLLNLGGSVKKTNQNTIRLKFKSNPDKVIQAKGQADGSAPPIEKQQKRKTPREKE